MQCSNRAAWAPMSRYSTAIPRRCAASTRYGQSRAHAVLHTRRGGASLPAGRSRHCDPSRAGLNHAEIDHGALSRCNETARVKICLVVIRWDTVASRTLDRGCGDRASASIASNISSRVSLILCQPKPTPTSRNNANSSFHSATNLYWLRCRDKCRVQLRENVQALRNPCQRIRRGQSWEINPAGGGRSRGEQDSLKSGCPAEYRNVYHNHDDCPDGSLT
jgi:hypothetical protein